MFAMLEPIQDSVLHLDATLFSSPLVQSSPFLYFFFLIFFNTGQLIGGKILLFETEKKILKLASLSALI